MPEPCTARSPRRRVRRRPRAYHGGGGSAARASVLSTLPLASPLALRASARNPSPHPLPGFRAEYRTVGSRGKARGSRSRSRRTPGEEGNTGGAAWGAAEKRTPCGRRPRAGALPEYGCPGPEKANGQEIDNPTPAQSKNFAAIAAGRCIRDIAGQLIRDAFVAWSSLALVGTTPVRMGRREMRLQRERVCVGSPGRYGAPGGGCGAPALSLCCRI